MAYPTYLREKARELRIKRKLSLLEIAERLALPKTTVFYWIRDLPDPEIKHRDSPARARARAKGSRGWSPTTSAARRRVSKRMGGVPELCLEPTFRDFVCMYIGEGYKRNRNVVSLGNSDPRVVRLADQWIRRLSRNRLAYSVQYHADQDPMTCVASGARRLVWIQHQSVSSANPTATDSRPGLGGPRYGVLDRVVRRHLLRARLQAWMDRTEEQWLDSLGAGV